MSLFCLACAIVTTTVAQLSYKLSFHKKNRVYLFFALIFFAVTPFLAFLALKELSLSFVYMSTGLTYVLVLLSARFILKEELFRRQIYAVALIAGGVVVFNL